MRCLNRVYALEGECDVCHMKLKPYVTPKRKLMGYNCPLHRSDKIFEKGGACPFCGLQLKEAFDGPPHPHLAHAGLRQWPLLNGRTAVYFRPFEVRKIGIEKYLRGAGRLRGLRLSVRIPKTQQRGLKRGLSAMVMPPQGYSRPVLATIDGLGPGDQVTLRLTRPIVGSAWALTELRVTFAPALAVPLTALLEYDDKTHVFVMRGENFEPRAISVTARGESYAAITGLEAGEFVAGTGVFWLEADWRMEHP